MLGGPPHSPKKLYVSPRPGLGDWFVEVSPIDEPGHLEYIPPELSRRTVNRLVRRYEIPKPWFYNPLLIPGDEEKKPPQ
jgi:hypothetical protein